MNAITPSPWPLQAPLLLVAVQGDLVLVAQVRESEVLSLHVLASRIQKLGSGAERAVFTDHKLQSDAFLIAGEPMAAVAEHSGLPEDLLDELQGSWRINGAAEPEYAIVQGIELPALINRLHAACLVSPAVWRCTGICVSTDGGCTLQAQRIVDGHAHCREMALPSEVALLQICDCEDFQVAAP